MRPQGDRGHAGYCGSGRHHPEASRKQSHCCGPSKPRTPWQRRGRKNQASGSRAGPLKQLLPELGLSLPL